MNGGVNARMAHGIEGNRAAAHPATRTGGVAQGVCYRVHKRICVRASRCASRDVRYICSNCMLKWYSQLCAAHPIECDALTPWPPRCHIIAHVLPRPSTLHTLHRHHHARVARETSEDGRRDRAHLQSKIVTNSCSSPKNDEMTNHSSLFDDFLTNFSSTF